MFTGLVEMTGVLVNLHGEHLTLRPSKPFADPQYGESVAVNGCCLTLERELPGGTLEFFTLAETQRRTNLGRLKPGSLLNIERALRVGDRLGVAQTRFGALGVTICADNSSSSLVLAESLCRMGAQIVLSPCAWAVPPDCARAYYGAEWYGPYARLAKLYQVPTVGVSNVGAVPAGAWAGWSCIGSSIALFPDGVSGATLPYGKNAECLRVLDVPLRGEAPCGTALSAEVERRRRALTEA